MMSEGNMNVSEHFRKHFKSTEDFRSWPSMSEVDPKMFRLYMSLSNIKWSIDIVQKLLFFCHISGQTLITFVVNRYYVCGQLLILWSRLLTFVVFVTFAVNYYICGFYTCKARRGRNCLYRAIDLWMKWAMRNMIRRLSSALIEKIRKFFRRYSSHRTLRRNMLRRARSRALGQKLSTYLVVHRCLSDRFAPSRRHRKSGLLLNRLWSLIHA